MNPTATAAKHLEILDTATRREFLAMLGAAGLLAACGSGSGAGAGDEVATRTVTDFFGNDIEVPERPQRIVAADDTALGNLLDLGVTPVATAVNLLSVPEFLGPRLDGIEDVSSSDDLRVNLEALAAVRPDLILTFGVDFGRDLYDALGQVAPTFAYAYGYATSDEIRTNMTDLGRVLGLEDRAAAEVARLDDRVAELAARAVEAGIAGEEISVLRVGGGGFYSLRHGSTETVLLDEVGFGRPPGQRSVEDFATDLSLERIDEADGHAIYVYVDSDGAAEMEALEANPLWPTLDAVRNDRVFVVDSGVWNGISLPAAHAILDDIEATLLS